jgi:hypothetical protein
LNSQYQLADNHLHKTGAPYIHDYHQYKLA